MGKEDLMALKMNVENGYSPTLEELLEFLDDEKNIQSLGGDFFEKIHYWDYMLYDKLDVDTYASLLRMMLQYYCEQGNAAEFWGTVVYLDHINRVPDLREYDMVYMTKLGLERAKKTKGHVFDMELSMIEKYVLSLEKRRCYNN